MLLWCDDDDGDDDDGDDDDCDDDDGDGDLSMIFDENMLKSPRVPSQIHPAPIVMIHRGVGCVKANLQTSSRQITDGGLNCSFKRQL